MLYRIAKQFTGRLDNNPDEDNEREISAKIRPVLESIRHYLAIDDDLQPQRLEWILGFPMLAAKKSYDDKLIWGIGANGSDKCI